MLRKLAKVTGTSLSPKVFFYTALLLTMPIVVMHYTLESNPITNAPRKVLAYIMQIQKRLQSVYVNGIEPVSAPDESTTGNRQIHIHYYNPPPYLRKYNVVQRCPKNCSMSYGNGPDYYDKDAVIFHRPLPHSSPVKKRPGQIWVLVCREPMAYYPNLRAWNSLFNWTVTYRRDSDIPNLYCRFEKNLNHSTRISNMTSKFSRVIDTNRSSKRRKRFALSAWFVSHCLTHGRREDYVDLLQKSHPVDVYGKCRHAVPLNRTEGFALLDEKYKFYLSFENSLCKDYVTEKSFNIYRMKLNVIPITRGFPNVYSLYLPPGSYIDTNDFKDSEHLGLYLNELAKNHTRYQQYFQWKNYYQADFDGYYQFCELCIRLHEPNVNTKYQRVYRDIDRWVFGSSELTTITYPKDINKRP